MANFYTDNEDIQFLFEHMDVAHVAEIMEEGFSFHEEFDFAPENAQDALDNYARILEVIGEITGNDIAPTAEDNDRIGNVLNDDNTVTYAPGIANALYRLNQAGAMGFTLPYRFGGINCPALVATINNDIVARGDAALNNLYGLQGIAETINAFASEDQKQRFLPPMATGGWTGAMVLTETEAGSDLQAVNLHAYQDEDGNWRLHGVKRFITNGCGEVLLVLARSEPEISDGRGLSMFIMKRDDTVTVRRLEDKLGIHASPTCELFFDHSHAELVGERQRGLITYVMSLMNGARIGIAAQSLGLGEAACRDARDYAHSRKQFGTAIENFAAVRELLVDMQVDLQAARALTYYASYTVDIENGALRQLGKDDFADADAKRAAKQLSRKYGRYNKVLTPMSKYYASEMSMRTANSSIAVLGGSGFMRDYACERYLRDSRITTIYEGTSQLQVVAAVAGVVSGTLNTVVEEMIDGRDWPAQIAPMIAQIRDGLDILTEMVEFIKTQPSPTYRDLYARKLVDIGTYLFIAALFCDHATASEKKLKVAQRWMNWRMPEIRMNKEMILSGDMQIVDDFEDLAGQLPVIE